MIKPDIIVSWPRNCDYPLWRQFIHDNREKFNLVIVVFTETNVGENYREFVKKAMAKDWVLFAENPEIPGGEDWRNVAVNHALIQSYNAEWVWFTEQDFFPKDGFWENVQAMVDDDLRYIAVKQGDRIHPCSLFLRRDLLSSLRKDFAANPPEYDHFGNIQKQLEQREERIGVIHPDQWQHLNGLSHNMRLVSDGGLPNYDPKEFDEYVQKCMKVTVPLDARFVNWANSYFQRVGTMR